MELELAAGKQDGYGSFVRANGVAVGVFKLRLRIVFCSFSFKYCCGHRLPSHRTAVFQSNILVEKASLVFGIADSCCYTN